MSCLLTTDGVAQKRSGFRQSAESRGCWARPCSLLTPNGPIQNSFFSLRTWHYLHVEAFESWGLETAADWRSA
eukprot:scaffold22467_cov74-Cyclotella_meneghiniana.AAC.4